MFVPRCMTDVMSKPGGGGISEIFPKIGCVFGVRIASGAQNYEISPKIGYVFGVRTTLGALDCEIFLKYGLFSESGFP